MLTGTLDGGPYTGIFDVNIDPNWSITYGSGSLTDNCLSYRFHREFG